MRIVLLFGFILSFVSLSGGSVPVLLWESSKNGVNNSFPALHTMSEDKFKIFILNKIPGKQRDPLLVMFVEERLSLEDFSWRDSQDLGNFPRLQRLTETTENVEFLPSVQSTNNTINELSKVGCAFDFMDMQENLSGCNKIIILKMPEQILDKNRSDILRRHDENIAAIYNRLLLKNDHVIGVLTGLNPSWTVAEGSRSKRHLGRATRSIEYIIYQDAKGVALLITKSHPKLVYQGNEIFIGNNSEKRSVTGDNTIKSNIKLIADFSSGYRLCFNFDNKTIGYWYLRTVDVHVPSTNQDDALSLRPVQEIMALTDMSYHSGAPVTFKYEGTTLTFFDIQIQPFFLNPGSKAFGDAVDAVPFFTPAIWSGIFVMFILAIIFTWGVSMILDIRAVDRFEDPKGDVITVNYEK